MALPLPKVVADTLPGGIGTLFNNMREQELKNQLQKLQNQYYAPSIESEIANRNALTQEQNIQNQYAPERLRLANELATMQNKYFIPTKESALASQAAQTAKTLEENKFIPTKYSIQQMNAQIRARELNNQVNNSFRLWSQTPEGQKIISNSPSVANAILQNMRSQAQIMMNNSMNNIPQIPSENAMTNNIPSNIINIPKTSNIPVNINNVPKNIYPEQKPASIVQNENPLPPDASNEDLIKDIQQGARDAYAKTNYPADTKKRLYAGARFKTTVPSILQNFELAKIYFSPKGQVQLKKDEFRAMTEKRVPPALQAYRMFKQGLEQAKVQGAFLEGVPADQMSREAYGQVYNISKFFNNPDDAFESLKYAINLALMADESNRQSLSEISNPNQQDKQIKNVMGGNKSQLPDPLGIR